jgi:acyl-CoA thioester hydrolase
MSTPVAYVFPCQTRWGDMDAYQHLNNGVYVDYLQEARVGFLHSGDFAHILGDEPLPGGDGPNPNAILVTGHEVEYLRPAEHGQDVVVRLVVDRIGAARFTLAYDIVANDIVVARARTVLCPFDLWTNQIRRLTEPERAWFGQFVEPVEPLAPLRKVRLNGHTAHEYPLRVRWSDLDSYRHVNNVKYYDYVQEARIALMQQVLACRPPQQARVGPWIVARQDMDYAVQIDFRPEPYMVRTGVQRIGTTSLTLAAEIVDPFSGTVFAAARSVLVHTTVQGPTPIPAWVRDNLASWLLESVAG